MRKLIIFICLFLGLASYTEACRFWVGVGSDVKSRVMDHLVTLPNSMKNLGKAYQDGWSIGYIENGKPIVVRSASASNVDDTFDETVKDISIKDINIAFSHLRRASSGCVEGVDNPHPFKLIRNQTPWLFGHNGGMEKQILINLIGNQYLRDYPPVVCNENAPESWIDSELYFIYLMKSIEDNNWNVENGIRSGLNNLFNVIAEDKRYLNFFLINGENIWAYRNGTSLYYLYDENKNETYVTSSIPHDDQNLWIEFPINKLAILKPNKEIIFISMEQ